MPDLSAFPITKRWPAKHPDRLAALFAADAERRQGLDHAGRDRAALRGASRRLRQGRPEDAGISVAESERQDPGDPRSRWARRQAARPVRVRRDPAIPRREDRQAAAGGCRAPLADHSVGALPDGRHRADVRPGRLLPQIRRQGFRGQAAAASATSPSPSACSACWRRASPAGNGSWTTNIPSPIFRCSAGCAT